MVEIFFLNLKDWTKWKRKIGVRSCFVTSGAFGHGLTYILCFFIAL